MGFLIVIYILCSIHRISSQESSTDAAPSPPSDPSATSTPAAPSVSSAPSTPSPPVYDENAVRIKILDEHNRYRAMHNTENLTLDDSLNTLAADWAKALSEKGNLEKKTPNNYGENNWRKEGKLVDLMANKTEKPTKIWYDQKEDYEGFPTSDLDQMNDAFTQLIWKSTKKLGVGLAEKGGFVYVVCFYDPKGNVASGYQANVLPLIGQEWPDRPEAMNIWWYVILMVIFGVLAIGWTVYRRRRRTTTTGSTSARPATTARPATAGPTTARPTTSKAATSKPTTAKPKA